MEAHVRQEIEAAMQAGAKAPVSAESDDALWYKDAIVYELHVKAFQDGNADGIGDFKGLTDRLDYLQDLGVNTLWLLPFYPSPMKDDGYDVSDYHNIDPRYGTRNDFRVFVREAHRRGLRVITELVVNHTSDQHAWFQAARRAPKGSAKRDYYVWSDNPSKYSGTRIIFTDTEVSNWAWDNVAQSYYWHRFFSHQPDLNFDNPHVLKAVVRTMRFWLDMGVDGFRLDAIPYLVEREGTNNENLPETHAVIKQIRSQLDSHYRNRLLLAEANQWPEDVREYFGDGDECHMAYHFPLMPRLFMAMAMEDRHPVVEIMQQTPEIPDSCQWAIFLRNHDELTLEMVTDRERDYMYKIFASDPRMRVNVGIRRRLAPLMENDREQIELMSFLLMTMPGSPILYYGDEIGMGDNIFLGDRNGVRTPMQWSPDRNAGFSRADPQRLYLPPIMDPVYGYEAVNVEAQARSSSSLLNWTRRLIAVRKNHRAFGRGRLRFLHPGNRKILAYLREYGDEVILCVVNLSRHAQAVELDLHSLAGRVPVEIMGRESFPPIGRLPYTLTLAGRGYYAFSLAKDAPAPDWHAVRVVPEDLAVLVLFDGWKSFFRDQVVPWRIGMAEKLRQQLEAEVMPKFTQNQRWFAGKGTTLQRMTIADYAEWSSGGTTRLLTLFRAETAPAGPAAGAAAAPTATPQPAAASAVAAGAAGVTDTASAAATTAAGAEVAPESGAGGAATVPAAPPAPRGPDTYFVPLSIAFEEDKDDEPVRRMLPAAVARVRQQARVGVLADAIADATFCRELVLSVGRGDSVRAAHGTIRFVPTARFGELAGEAPEQLTMSSPGASSTNSVALMGDRLFVKLYRRLQSGINPEVEIGRFLTEVAKFPNVAAVAGVVEYDGADGQTSTLAILQELTPNQGDAWSYTLGYLERFLDRVKTQGPAADPPDVAHAAFLEMIATLGRRTAEMHLALATRNGDPAFEPEPIGAEDIQQWVTSVQTQAAETFDLLQRRVDQLSDVARAGGRVLLERGRELMQQRIGAGSLDDVAGLKTRYHADYHLGQVLVRETDFVIIDFEGEPGRTLDERRRKAPPLRDVAGMLRSFNYASYAALLRVTSDLQENVEALEPAARDWEMETARVFLTAYRSRVQGSDLYGEWSNTVRLLDLFLIEKALYELRYELNNRPDWAPVPIRGLAGLLTPAI